MLNLRLHRFEFGDKWTIGRLFVDEVFQCYTLEDVVRDSSSPKVPGATAIPRGTYKVIIDHSTRFNKDMPHVLNVPGFTGIRIHSGNTDKDTEGCILLGNTWAGGDWVGQSGLAFSKFFPQLQSALVNDVAVLTIE